MKIIIIQKSSFHSEIFGCFIQLFQSIYKDCEIIIYCNYNPNISHIEYFQKIFSKITVKKYDEQMINLEPEDIIFINTDFEKSKIIKEKFKNIDLTHNKILEVAHLLNKSPLTNKIILSPVLNKYLDNYILPIHTKYYKINPKRNIFTVFNINPHLQEKDINLLKHMINTVVWKNKNMFIVLSRFNKKEYDDFMNFLDIKKRPITIYLNPPTDKLFVLLHLSKFMIPLLKPGTIYTKNRLSGSIPLALNRNIPMILHSDVAKIYDLNECCLEYNTNNDFITMFNQACNMSFDRYLQLIKNGINYKQKVFENNKEKLIKFIEKIQ